MEIRNNFQIVFKHVLFITNQAFLSQFSSSVDFMVLTSVSHWGFISIYTRAHQLSSSAQLLIQDNTGVCVNQSEYSFSFLFRFSSIDFIIGIIDLSFGYQFVVVIFSVFAMNLFSLVVTQPPPQAFLGEIVFLPYKRPRGRLVITELQWFKGSYALLFNMSMLSDCYQQFYRRALITLQANLVYFLVLFSSHSLFGIIGFSQVYLHSMYFQLSFRSILSFSVRTDFVRLCKTCTDFTTQGPFVPSIHPTHRFFCVMSRTC